QAAGDWVRLGQPHLDAVAEREDAAAALSLEAVAIRIVTIEVVSERTNRHQPVGADPIEGHEDAELGHTGDAALEAAANAIGEIGGNVSVARVALGRRPSTLGVGDVLGDAVEIDGTTFE